MNKSESIGALAAALAKAQGAMTHASKDATNPHFRSKYADLAAVVEAIRVPLSENGLAYSQLCDFTESGGLILETVLMHESGEWISGRMQMPLAKNDPQGVGSGVTYAKRYSLAAIVGLAADEDDDGEGAMGRKSADQPQQRNQSRQQAPKSPAHPPQEGKPKELSPEQVKYQPRLLAALHTLHGDDNAAKKATVKANSALPAKGNFPAREGVEDYRTLDGDRLKFLTHAVEALAAKASPTLCSECRQPNGTHAPSCPLAQPE